MSKPDLLDSLDVALRLGVSKGRVTEALARNPRRYGAWKERGPGGRHFRFKERWRVPRESLELLRADLKHGRSLA